MLTDHSDYRPLLKTSLSEKKERLGRLYTFSEMAGHCRVQKTYLSRVLNGEGHLSRDQLYLACRYLHFGAHERDYVFALHEYQRSELPERKRELTEEISKLKMQLQKTDPHLSVPPTSVATDALALYYLDPTLQLLHVFLTVERYAKNPLSLASRLGVSESRIAEALAALQGLSLIELHKGKYRVLKSALHLSAESPLYLPWRVSIRVKTLARLQADARGAYSFSVFFSANEEVRDKIQNNFLKFLRGVEKLAKGARSDEVYQMNFDLFGW